MQQGILADRMLDIQELQSVIMQQDECIQNVQQELQDAGSKEEVLRVVYETFDTLCLQFRDALGKLVNNEDNNFPRMKPNTAKTQQNSGTVFLKIKTKPDGNKMKSDHQSRKPKTEAVNSKKTMANYNQHLREQDECPPLTRLLRKAASFPDGVFHLSSSPLKAIVEGKQANHTANTENTNGKGKDGVSTKRRNIVGMLKVKDVNVMQQRANSDWNRKSLVERLKECDVADCDG